MLSSHGGPCQSGQNSGASDAYVGLLLLIRLTRSPPACLHVQVPDFINARIGGIPAPDVIRDMKWFREEFTPKVRGAPTGGCGG